MWDGIVIADQVGMINGNPTVSGGVISLASGGAGVDDRPPGEHLDPLQL